MIEVNSQQGFFIGEKDLPPHIIKKALNIARVNNKDFKTYLLELIIQDVKDFEDRKTPLLNRAIEEAAVYLKKNFYIGG